MDNERKKIIGQKNAALFLIAGPIIMLLAYIFKKWSADYGIYNYLICGALLVLIVVGGVGYYRSSKRFRP
ncbi:MAG: hypothetical protein WBA16_01305 [Nonlabens sp.]